MTKRDWSRRECIQNTLVGAATFQLCAGQAAGASLANFEKESKHMQYLVEMKLVTGRPTTPEDGMTFIEQVIFPSLEMCKKLQEQKKILAGGPISGTIELAMIVEAGSALELDDLIETLPVWSLTETSVTPLPTFEDRIKAIRPRLGQLKGDVQK